MVASLILHHGARLEDFKPELGGALVFALLQALGPLGMRPFPFGKETVIPLVVTVVLPGLPLVLTVIPLDELVQRLLGALL